MTCSDIFIRSGVTLLFVVVVYGLDVYIGIEFPTMVIINWSEEHTRDSLFGKINSFYCFFLQKFHNFFFVMYQEATMQVPNVVS